MATTAIRFRPEAVIRTASRKEEPITARAKRLLNLLRIIRGRIAISTMDIDDSVPAKSRYSTAEALRRSEELVLRWRGHPRVNAWLSLRQLLVNSQELRIGMRELSHALDTPLPDARNA